MILVVGTGVAGLSAALAAVEAGGEVELVTPGELDATTDAHAGEDPAAAAAAGGNTALAQGGVAAAVSTNDRAQDHLADTIAAGAGLVDPDAARVLTSDGVRSVQRLLDTGFPADRLAGGELSLGLEGAHGRNRIVHAGGDRTGRALHALLTHRVLAAAALGRLLLTERTRVDSLVMDSGAIAGAVLKIGSGLREYRRADAVVLATGGYAGIFPRTSNYLGSQGSGILLAARVGAAVADLEFVQFHPTVLHVGASAHPDVDAHAVAGQRVQSSLGPELSVRGDLISEAVRGAGAVLRDGSGDRFMVERHPLAELAPRDIVSREIHRVLRDRGEQNVWLDATEIERSGGPGFLARRFPGITTAVAAHGLDWSREPIPVSPAAHYTMGGVASDLDGRSSVPGLFVAGETAATGVHGANRLASNSLLEGLVFGERAGRAAAATVSGTWISNGAGFDALVAGATLLPSENNSSLHGRRPGRDSDADTALGTDSVASAIAGGLGILRDAKSLHDAATVFARVGGARAELAALMCAAATVRQESRGAHQRADFPEPNRLSARRQAFRHMGTQTWPLAASVAPSVGLPEDALVRTPVFSAIPVTNSRSVSSC